MTLAIVAIPSKDDYVWKISSEKIPHVTILALGDKINNLAEVTDYIQHVVDTCLVRFGLSVDHRGTLGPQSADVLFFNDYCVDKLKDVRSYFLTDPNIFLAYNQVSQFEEWTPHLTLGYPATPAKQDNRDYPGIGWINFDQIALWTGDYEGVEFPLKTQNDTVAAYSEAGARFLAHFGVKGMKWGVRRDHSEAAGRIQKDLPTAQKLKADPTKKAYGKTTKATGGLHKLSDTDLRKMVERMDLERKYTKAMNEERDRRIEGLKAVGRILGEVGKIALPIVVSAAAGAAAARAAGTYRTAANASRVIEGTARAIGA